MVASMAKNKTILRALHLPFNMPSGTHVAMTHDANFIHYLLEINKYSKNTETVYHMDSNQRGVLRLADEPSNRQHWLPIVITQSIRWNATIRHADSPPSYKEEARHWLAAMRNTTLPFWPRHINASFSGRYPTHHPVQTFEVLNHRTTPIQM